MTASSRSMKIASAGPCAAFSRKRGDVGGRGENRPECPGAHEYLIFGLLDASSITDLRVAPLPRWLWGSMPRIRAISGGVSDHPLWIDPGLNSHFGQHRDQILGREIPERAEPGRHRDPAADPADRAFQPLDAGVERCENFAVAMPERLWMWKPKPAFGNRPPSRANNRLTCAGSSIPREPGHRSDGCRFVQAPHHGDYISSAIKPS